jgi:hypothetical protein
LEDISKEKEMLQNRLNEIQRGPKAGQSTSKTMMIFDKMIKRVIRWVESEEIISYENSNFPNLVE